MKEISIWWEGPFTQSEIINGKIDSKVYSNTADRIGLYQVYGSHPLYGNDVLLYIGRTKDKNGFSRRLKNRWVVDFGNDKENIKIYLGTIYSPKFSLEEKEINEQIDLAEVLLIHAHKPAYNSSNVQSVGEQYIKEKCIVQNRNNYRNLFPVLSSEYFLESQDVNFMYVDKLAKLNNEDVVDEDEYYGFLIGKNDEIFVGIDYECWDTKNVPLQIAIDPEKVDEQEIKKVEAKYKKIDHNFQDDRYVYFKTIDSLEGNIEENCQSIQEMIDDIVELLKIER